MKTNLKRFWFSLAVLLQLALLAKIPSGQIEALQTGRAIRLKAYAVDRDNIWSGSYLRLKYDISRPVLSLAWQEFKPGTDVFILLQREEDGTWAMNSLLRKKPENLGSDRVFLKGKIQDDGVLIYTVLRRQPDGSWQADSVAEGKPAPSFFKDRVFMLIK